MAERERVTKKRVVGHLLQWKGKYGWIRPNEAIQHPDAGKRGGKIYLGMEDIEGPDLEVKSMVSFIVYADETGLGAMHCMPAPGAAKPKGEGKGAKNGKGLVQKSFLKPKGVTGTTRKGGAKGPFIPSRIESGKGASKATKGKGKGSGKVKMEEEEGEERTPPPPPDKDARERITPSRIIGKLIRWRGTIGWIKPAEKVEHPEAKSRKKGIYVHEVDVQPGHELFQGAQVRFFVYVDADGLGAEHVMLCKEQPVQEEPQAKGRTKGREPSKPKGKGKGKGKGTGEKLTMVEKMKKLKRRRKGKKGSGDGEKKKAGPDLPRERVTTLPVLGEVVEWKGKFGWITPAEEVEHEQKNEKHEGKIYVHEKDILVGAPLTTGQSVEFHVYADSSGLGAEEVVVT